MGERRLKTARIELHTWRDFTEASGGSSISSATTILGDATYYAHWSDAIPPLSDGATVEMVAEALSGSADERLIERVGTVGAYQSYRQWIVQKSLAHKDVRASRNSWLAYAIDSPMLIGKSPVANEDLSIVSFAPSGNMDGTFKLVFGIDDTEIGDGATPERIAEAFEIEGATELSTAAFSSDRVSVAFERSADGKANAMITPIGNPRTFFMRVKIN